MSQAALSRGPGRSLSVISATSGARRCSRSIHRGRNERCRVGGIRRLITPSDGYFDDDCGKPAGQLESTLFGWNRVAEAGRYWETGADPIYNETVKTNVVSTFCFIAFVIFGLLGTVRGRFLPAEARRRLTNIFLWVVLFISLGAGLTQRNLWPFSSWPVLAYPGPASGNYSALPRIMGVDIGGNEYDIDYRAWQPVELEELLSWIRFHLGPLDPVARDRLGAYFLSRSNLAREQALSSAGLPYPNRWFGPLTAPAHMLHPAIWSRSESVPRKPFIELRVYEEKWNPEERSRDPQKVTRVLIFDYRQ